MLAQALLAALHEIEGARAALADAAGADAADDQAMAAHAKAMRSGHGVADLDDLIAVELEQLLALLAVEMIVLRIAVVMLIDSPPVEIHLSQDARIDHLGQRAIDGRPTGFFFTGLTDKHVDQLISVEMLVPLEDLLDDHAPLLRHALAAALQKLLESLERRQRDFDIFQCKIRHNEPHFNPEPDEAIGQGGGFMIPDLGFQIWNFPEGPVSRLRPRSLGTSQRTTSVSAPRTRITQKKGHLRKCTGGL